MLYSVAGPILPSAAAQTAPTTDNADVITPYSINDDIDWGTAQPFEAEWQCRAKAVERNLTPEFKFDFKFDTAHWRCTKHFSIWT